MHDGERLVECDICGNSFSSLIGLLTHRRYHDDEYRERVSKHSRDVRKSKEYKEKIGYVKSEVGIGVGV